MKISSQTSPLPNQMFHAKPMDSLERVIHKVWSSLFSKAPNQDDINNVSRQIRNKFDPLNGPYPKEMTIFESEQLAQKIWKLFSTKPLTQEEVRFMGEELRNKYGYNQTVINEIRNN